MVPLTLESLSESERESTNEWLARLEQISGDPVTDIALTADTAVPTEAEAAGPTNIVPAESAGMLTADVISGAPCAYTDFRSISFDLFVYQRNSVTDRSECTRRRETRCRAVEPRASGGGLTGIFSRAEAAGRILSWDGPARAHILNLFRLIMLTFRHGSADYMQGTRLTFKSQEDAIHFAKKQGASVDSRHLIYLTLNPLL